MTGPGGFFSYEETEARIDVAKRTSGCGACKLHKSCKHPRMKVAGKGRKGILVVAEAPGRREDARGQPLAGASAILLKGALVDLGIDLERDCWKTNAVICRTPEDRTPTDDEIMHCRPHLFKTIQKLKPKGIIVLGGAAMKALIQHRWLGDQSGVGGINRWRGWTIPDQELGCWICPTYHPSYISRMEREPVVELLFERDLNRAVHTILKEDFPSRKDDKSRLIYLTKKADIKHAIETVTLQSEFAVFDYETTGLRAQGEGHRIISVALTTPDRWVYTFPWPKDPSDNLAWPRFLSSRVLKGAHNIPFEDTWSIIRGGAKKVRNWFWDSQSVAHILDNRPKITSLKFQTYVHFGVIDYDSHMKQYLIPSAEKKEAHGANAINQLPTLVRSRKGLRTLLTYGGLDGLYEIDLAMKQMEQVGQEVPRLQL